MSSIQAYKAHKQEGTIAATTLVSKMHKQGGIFEFPSIPTSVAALHVKQPSSFLPICCYLELISISYNYHAATDVGMLGNSKMPPCLCILLTSVVAAIVPSCLCAL